ncbi:MAG: TetR/AcrR family transcriptional regulator [Deltaproteobacteria bacterium]|nr:TetR/AcrR family transcriptional regulator [Deltaproteobacteria bacterium]
MPPRRSPAKPKSRRPVRRAGEAKRDATRRTLLERALGLFQQHGVEATTMRDIARAAGLSLGAAYYYFPSKEALVFAFYEDNQARMEEMAARVSGSVRDKLGAIFHGKLESIQPHRAMLASIVSHLVNPGDPLSAFSAQTRSVRARAIAVFEQGLDGSGLPAAVVPVVANTLWLLTLACMLVYIHDDSPNEAKTHQLVDDGLDMLVPMFPLLATPMGIALCERILTALTRAGIRIAT